MVKAIKGTNLELFDMNECDDLDATVDGGDVLYTGFWSNILISSPFLLRLFYQPLPSEHSLLEEEAPQHH